MVTVDNTLLPRRLAEDFCYPPNFVEGHTSHDAWKHVIVSDPEYFKQAYRLLHDLASLFFSGFCPWEDEEKGWALFTAVDNSRPKSVHREDFRKRVSEWANRHKE